MSTYILFSVKDVNERIADLKRQSANAKKAKCIKDVEQIAFEIAAIEETLRKGKLIPLDEKDIEAKAFKGYYEYHNWNEEEQKRESIINLARGGKFTSGYKQALKDLISE